jgi:hypothetical protein
VRGLGKGPNRHRRRSAIAHSGFYIVSRTCVEEFAFGEQLALEALRLSDAVHAHERRLADRLENGAQDLGARTAGREGAVATRKRGSARGGEALAEAATAQGGAAKAAALHTRSSQWKGHRRSTVSTNSNSRSFDMVMRVLATLSLRHLRVPRAF